MPCQCWAIVSTLTLPLFPAISHCLHLPLWILLSLSPSSFQSHATNAAQPRKSISSMSVTVMDLWTWCPCGVWCALSHRPYSITQSHWLSRLHGQTLKVNFLQQFPRQCPMSLCAQSTWSMTGLKNNSCLLQDFTIISISSNDIVFTNLIVKITSIQTIRYLTPR